MLILVTLKRLWRAIVEEAGIYAGKVPERKLQDLARRSRALAECPTHYGLILSRIMDNVRGPGMTHEQARQFSRLVQANSGAPMQETCFKHDDRKPTFVLNETTLYLCDDCAEEQREHGNIVRPLLGTLWGFPVVNADDDGILDARVIGDE